MPPAYIGDMTIARRIRIAGRVQGVFFRDWTVETARGLGLSGWVRNRHDSSVEIFAHGAEEAVAQLIAACHDGPPHARVDRVDVSEDSDESVGKGFVRRPTL
jgi:acylphosphatase